MTPENLEELYQLPSLIAYERRCNQAARLGKIDRIRIRQAKIRIEYSIIPGLPEIQSEKLFSLERELDIQGLEQNRIHWAIKGVYLRAELIAANIIQEVQFQALPVQFQALFMENQPGPELHVQPFEGIAKELFTLINGHDPKMARQEHVAPALAQAAKELKLEGFTDRFLMPEWRYVVDHWQIDGLEAYARVPRLGRKNRLGNRQRESLWSVFERAREILAGQHRYTPASIFGAVAAYYKGRANKPFTHIIVDEAQD